MERVSDRSIRGAAAITGFAEIKPERRKPGRTAVGLAAELAKNCVEDAGLTKDQVNGLITHIPYSHNIEFAEYLGLKPVWSHSVDQMGGSGATSLTVAAAAVATGLADNVLVIVCSSQWGGFGGGTEPSPDGHGAQYVRAHGPGPGANYEYAQIAMRYQHLYNLSDEDRVAIAVQQRENAQANPDAVFYGQPATAEDILNSRMVADPLRLLECVMPCIGGAAVIVSAADETDYSPNPPVYLLGAGCATDRGVPGLSYAPDMTISPVKVSAERAFATAGLTPQDMDIAQIYDCYTIAIICEFEDAGFAPKGEGGPWFASHDVTYKGELPINTHGGQLSFGQAGSGGGMSHVVEGVRQMMGRGEARQAHKDLNYAFINNNGGGLSVEASLVFGKGVD